MSKTRIVLTNQTKVSFVENRPVPVLFILICYLTGDFGACNELTTEQAALRKSFRKPEAYDMTFARFFKSSPLREYKTQINRAFNFVT